MTDAQYDGPKAEKLASGLGIFAEPYPRALVANATSVLDATHCYYVLCPFRKDEVVTNIVCYVGTAGASLTLVRLGIYSSAGAKLAVTGDVKASFASNNVWRENPLASPYTIPASGDYYLGIVQNGTTLALLGCANVAPVQSAAKVVGSSLRVVASSNDTDLPTTATFAALTENLYLAAS